VGRAAGLAAATAGSAAPGSGSDGSAAPAALLGYGVRVNCVCPGLVATDMGLQLAQDVAALGLFASPEHAVGEVIGLTPLGRLGEVADMADAVAFLAGEGSRFITGALLPVDGGMGM
jgi:3alpha(or 20beta)-hydroxysteroid dehydrogenase